MTPSLLDDLVTFQRLKHSSIGSYDARIVQDTKEFDFTNLIKAWW